VGWWRVWCWSPVKNASFSPWWVGAACLDSQVTTAKLGSLSRWTLLIAIAAFFWANRLLPVSFAQRADWEVQMFFIAWGLSLLHAMLRRGRQAWVEQLAATDLLCLTFTLIYLITTGELLFAALVRGDGEMAGLGLCAIAFGLIFGAALRHLQRRSASEVRATAAAPIVEGA